MWIWATLLMIILSKKTLCQKLLQVSIDANSTFDCHQISDENVICQTLDEGLRYINKSLDEGLRYINKSLDKPSLPTVIEVVLLTKASLEKEVVINGAISLSISSLDEVEVNGTCKDRNETCGTSLVFFNIQHLKFQKVKLVNFGIFRLGGFCYSAVVIENAKTVTVSKLSISNSTGGLCFKNISGSVSIMQSELNNNWVKPSESCNKSSGGLWISTGNNVSSVYYITKCSFTNNSAGFYTKNRSEYLLVGKSHGGGFLFFIGKNTTIDLNMADTNFINNKATFGGGAAILATSSNKNSHVRVHMNQCNFSNNTAENSIISNGGGLQLLLQSGNNDITITNTTFTSNTAYFGGGTSIGSEPSKGDDGHKAIFVDCTWYNNIATSGAAVDISRMYTSEKISIPIKLIPVFTRCLFNMNSVEYSQKNILRESLGNGVFSISMMDAVFNTEAMFSNNTGSAIMGVDTTLTFNCSMDANFINNTGINGGAISLEAFSRLNITSGSKVFFDSNHASSNGGAIYFHISSDHMLFIRSVCPFTFYEGELHFFNNTAGKNGHSMYFTSLLPCQMELPNTDELYLSEADNIFKNKTFFHFYPGRIPYDIATAPSNFTKPLSKQVYPGEEFDLNLTLRDSLNQTVKHTEFFLFEISKQSISSVNDNTMCVSENKISLKGKEGENDTILLQTMDKPILNIVIQVNMTDCLPGFIFNENESTCVCQSQSFYGFKNCTTSGFYIFDKVWVGHINAKEDKHLFVSGLCYWFCHNGIKAVSKQNFSNNTHLQQQICNKHRKGILCSECKTNFSASFNAGGFKCISDEKCKFGFLFLIVSEILPFTALLIIVMVMNINMASGYIQGFILFCHILASLSVYPKGSTVYWYIFHIFYYPLDFKFYYNLPSFCLYKGATALQNTAMTYVTIIYCLLLIFTVVMFMRCFNRRFHNCNRFVRFTTAKNSAIHGLLALFLLSYTRCIQTSLILLQPTTLYKKGMKLASYRVGINGDWTYFSSHHLAYAIPAILFLILFLIPSVMLFLYPFFVKLQLYFNIEPRFAKASYIISKLFMYNALKPFYDMFYGSFHDNHRYFAGLYLFYRILISLPFYIPQEIDAFVVTEILLVVFLGIHAIAQPHAEKRHNTVDALLLANLIVINGSSTIDIIVQYTEIRSGIWGMKAAAGLQELFISLPIAVAICAIIHKYILKRCWKYVRGRNEYNPLLDSANIIMHHRSMGKSSDFTKYQ